MNRPAMKSQFPKIVFEGKASRVKHSMKQGKIGLCILSRNGDKFVMTRHINQKLSKILESKGPRALTLALMSNTDVLRKDKPYKVNFLNTPSVGVDKNSGTSHKYQVVISPL